MFPHIRKRLIIKIVCIVIPIFIFINAITKKASSPKHNIMPSLHYTSQQTTRDNNNSSSIKSQHEQTSKSQKCNIPLNNNLTSLAQRFPHIIIIGFGKAGTRALYQMIRMHPDVVGPSQELRFFSDNIKYKQGVHVYTKLMPATTETQRTIEKSPDYIIKAGVAARLKKAIKHCHRGDDIKFIVVLREPFKRAVSEYLHWKLYVKSFMGKTLGDFEKLAFKNSGEINNFLAQVNTSIYSYHLKNWLKIFDIKKICFVDGDALVKDPYSVVKKLEKCLKLRDFITSKHFYYNRKKGYYCPVNEKRIPKCLGSSKGRTHPHIDKNVEIKLRKFFEPYNKELFNITGINFGWM